METEAKKNVIKQEIRVDFESSSNGYKDLMSFITKLVSDKTHQKIDNGEILYLSVHKPEWGNAEMEIKIIVEKEDRLKLLSADAVDANAKIEPSA